MNRITRMTPKGAALIMAEQYDSPEEAKADVSARCRKAFERLYEYENLELEPEEISDLLQLTATIRSGLNGSVTWKSPHKDKAYKATLDAVEISRDIKTGKLRVSAKLLMGKQRTVVYADIKHILELVNTKLE